MSTLYDVLGVHEDAPDAEIKRAYRRAAMQAHPDRNVGREASAHSRFQEIKEAYSILSDPEQRRVYDAVYAEEMGRIDRDRRDEEERLRAEREAEYTRFVALAMRFAEFGHNRDVVFGVLLGRDCDTAVAGQIAHSVMALHASRQASNAKAADDDAASAAKDSSGSGQSTHAKSAAQKNVPDDDAPEDDERPHVNPFSTLWHSMFGLRS